MQFLFDTTISEQTESLDLVDLVADVAVALCETLRDPPPRYRRIRLSLDILMVEIVDIKLLWESTPNYILQQPLEEVAEALNRALRSGYVRSKYNQLVERDARTRLRFLWARPFVNSPQRDAERWSGFPYPMLGMLHELSTSHIRKELRVEDLLSDNPGVINHLIRVIKNWNNIVDQVYACEDSEYEEDTADRNHQKPSFKEAAFCGETSVRQLARSLYDILHHNWPCRVEDHEPHQHHGKLGHCLSAKFCLDPDWSSRVTDPTRDEFFVLLTGSDMFQECRVCLHTRIVTGDATTLVCLVDHENSRTLCLQLVKDKDNRLWGHRLGEPPETLQPDEEYVETSLGRLLDVVKPTYAAKRVLGLILARCLPHLLDSPWIPRPFCINDISLLCRLDNGRLYPRFDRLFLSTDFRTDHTSGSATSGQGTAYEIHPFPTILALGIILTEIELGDDLGELYRERSFANLRNRPFDLARRLRLECQSLFYRSGLLRAVNFCIERKSFRRFSNTNHEALFADQEFINAYYMNVVRPLEEDLVIGAGWTWNQVYQLERASVDNEGVCKSIARMGNNNSPLNQDNPQQQREVERLQGNEYTPPSTGLSRDDFEVAIICALPLEANAVLSLFDHRWDNDLSTSVRHPDDPNSYSVGIMAGRKVVLAHPSGIGKAMAASVAASCAMSFRNVKLALVVGVCGGAPFTSNREEILLGDVIVSKGVIQCDFGRQFSDHFRRKSDSLGPPNTRIGSLLAKLETEVHRGDLQEQVARYLLERDDISSYPGEEEDKLFESAYRHKHQNPHQCGVCADCQQHTDPVCDLARKSTCQDLGCDDTHLVQRHRRNLMNNPMVHFGLFASGDSVIKSSVHRDRASEKEDIIAFEMEGAGVWDGIPSVIIKGVCDYADSHKSKLWQEYAAATAAACTKAFVRQW